VVQGAWRRAEPMAEASPPPQTAVEDSGVVPFLRTMPTKDRRRRPLGRPPQDAEADSFAWC
jgi:hypothetical protein